MCVCVLVGQESAFFIHIPNEVWDPLLDTNIANYWVCALSHMVLWLKLSVVPFHWRDSFSLDQIANTTHYFMFLLPVGSYLYSGWCLLIFPDTSSITYFPDKSSSVIGPGRPEFPSTVSLYCSMLGCLDLGTFDIWGWIILCCGWLCCSLMDVNIILGSIH